MKDNITPKEFMLKKIRKALLQKRDNPYPNIEESELYKPMEDDLDIVFAQELMAAGGQFVFCENGIDFIENILTLADEFQWRKIYCWEPELQELLTQHEFPFYRSDKNFEEAEVGISLCEALIARSGSVVVSNKNAAGRRLSIFPNQHVVVAKTSQIVPDLKDAFRLMKHKYGQSQPSMTSVITGSSCSTTIENKLTTGGNGPKNLFVFMVDDFS